MATKAKKKPKASGRTYKTQAFSMHPEQYEKAKIRADALGFRTSFSAYIQYLVTRDLRSTEDGLNKLTERG